MGRTVRQKRKNRSSRPKVKQTNRPKKALNPLGNDLIAKNWSVLLPAYLVHLNHTDY